MPVSLTPASHSAVIARLRAAGCVFAEDEARLLTETAATQGELATMVTRRAAGEPLEYVLGWAMFCGLRIAVTPGVFVPRRRTEFLVRQAAALADTAPSPVVLDLCCGSGAIGAAVAAALGGAELHATDIDPAAVACARRNVPAGGRVYEGDLFRPLPAGLRGQVVILAANVPYVPTQEISLLPAEARLYEARTALDGGTDGLEVLRQVVAQAPPWLAPGGSLLTETSERQATVAASLVRQAGLIPCVAGAPELGATVLIGTKPRHTRPGGEERGANQRRSAG